MFDAAIHSSSGLPAPNSPPERESFRFTGSGSEYFRIWIVNLFLSIITLGIYSAWAKVRRTRYFYGATRVADASFDYHGNPLAILKGRAIALIGIVAYNAALEYSGFLGLVLAMLLALVVPWLLWKSLQFRLFNTSYRGIRFGFDGTAREAYTVFLLNPFLTTITFYLLAPFAHQRLKKFQHEHSRFGATFFSFSASVKQFYKVYLVAAVIILVGLGLLVIGLLPLIATVKTKAAGGSAAAHGMLVVYGVAIWAWMLMAFPIFMAMIQNLIWNHTELGNHAFKSNIKLGRMVFLSVTNVIGIVLTLGLFTPFAVIRMMKYRVESMTLLPDGDLDRFVALAEEEQPATGEGVADLLDFDLSL